MAIKVPTCPGGVSTDVSHWPIVVMKPPSRPMSDADFGAYLDWMEKHISLRGEIYALINDARHAPPISAAQRKMLADRMERLKPFSRRFCAGTAVVFESAVMRGVMTAIFWMSKPDYPVKVCASVDDAFGWCEVRLGVMQYVASRDQRLNP